jgi:small subunit ribosomal protein S16
VAVRIRMKKMGRRHRPFFRVCAVDSRAPRDGRVIEELGFYDPMIKDVNARAVLKGERIDYWLGVGAVPSDKVSVLIKKYGSSGTHLEQQKAALERLKTDKPQAPPPMAVPKPKKEEEAPAAEEKPAEEPAGGSETSDEANAAGDAAAETTEEKKDGPADGGESAAE